MKIKIVVLSVLLFVASCAKEYHTVGIQLFESQAISTEGVKLPVYSYQDATASVQTNGLPLGQLGYIQHPVFGRAEASITSQLQLTGGVFGNFSQDRENEGDEDNVAVIQERETVTEVFLDIPFFNNTKDSDNDGVIDAFDADPEDPQSDTDGDSISDLLETQSDLNPLSSDSDNDGILDADDDNNASYQPENKVYEIDSLYGNREASFDLKVHRLTYFLSNLDPDNNFVEQKPYYSNTDFYEQGFYGETLFDGEYTLNFDELRFNYKEDDPDTEDIDETQQVETRLTPRIRVPLDPKFFQRFVLNLEGQPELSSQNQFNQHLRGIIIRTENFSDDLYMLLDLANAAIQINYTYDELDQNGTTDDTSDDFITKAESSYSLNLSGVQLNTLKNALVAPQITEQLQLGNQSVAAEKIYIQGGRNHARIQLFDPENDLQQEQLERLRENNWLINEANLVFHIDPTAYNDPSVLPDRLYLYNYTNGKTLNDFDADQSLNLNVKNGDKYVFGGLLEYDDNDRPSHYKFRITNHVNNLIREDSTNVSLGLVVGSNTDFIAPKSAFLTAARGEINYPTAGILNPLGVVLLGSANTGTESLSLELFYTEY